MGIHRCIARRCPRQSMDLGPATLTLFGGARRNPTLHDNGLGGGLRVAIATAPSHGVACREDGHNRRTEPPLSPCPGWSKLLSNLHKGLRSFRIIGSIAGCEPVRFVTVAEPPRGSPIGRYISTGSFTRLLARFHLHLLSHDHISRPHFSFVYLGSGLLYPLSSSVSIMAYFLGVQ